MDKKIELEIDGLGIIFYSESNANHITDGEDYFESSYAEPEQVAKHAMEGTIVGFGTGSSGTYILSIKDGYPNDEELMKSEFKLRLGIEVKDNGIWFRDLFDLMDWNNNCPDTQFFELANGYYHVTLCGDIPESEILGDEQVINMYFNKQDSMPDLQYYGVPIYCE